MKTQEPKKNTELMKQLQRNWEMVALEISRVEKELNQLGAKRSILLNQLDAILKTFDVLGGRPDNLIVPPELQFKPNTTIGDAMESILKERGPLSKKELISILAGANLIKNPKNARVLIANAISKDSRKRFEISADKKVMLKQSGSTRTRKDTK
jgi:hypothetical protein